MFRTMQMTIYLALPIVFAVGCKPRILGSGSEETRTHDVASFNELRIGGDWEITVAAGDDQKVQVSTDDNLHQHISVKNRGGILDVRTTKSINPRTGLKVWIQSPKIKIVRAGGMVKGRVNLDTAGGQIVMAGRAKLEVRGIGGRIAANTKGAARLNLSGYADVLDLESSGASRTDAKGLRVRTANIKGTGATRATVNAREALTIHVEGVASVAYYGKPKVKVTGSGTSHVHALD